MSEDLFESDDADDEPTLVPTEGRRSDADDRSDSDDQSDETWHDRLRSPVARLWRWVSSTSADVLSAVASVVERVARFLLRPVGRFRSLPPQTQALVGVVVLLGAIAGVGAFLAFTSSMSTSGSSAPLLETVLAWTTSGWGYVLTALVFGRGTLWGVRRALVYQSARETGYEPRTIERLADEVATTDGTARAIAFGDDDLEGLCERVRSAFDGENDTIRLGDRDDVGGLPAPFEPAFEHEEETTDTADDLEASERFKLWRMDLASGLDADSVVWRFLLPVGIVLALELILVRFWVAPWVYPPLLAVALLAGIGFYQGSSWLRKRRLASLRESRDAEYWDEVSVLVKSVDTDEVTVHIGFLAGHSYASTDRERLVDVLAERAQQRCRGFQPAPAIEERYAWCLRRYIPNFVGWRENQEKADIMDRLVNEVLDSPEGMLPKRELANRVIEHDRRYVWRGLRFVGLGHDPDLVEECYRNLVPNTLVEREVTLEGPDGQRTVTSVRARTETLPPDVATVRASFSERYPAHKIRDRYDLPAVEVDEQTHGHVTT